jgi:hypothetical protein
MPAVCLWVKSEGAILEEARPHPCPLPEEREKRRPSRNILLTIEVIAGRGNGVTFEMEYYGYCGIISSEIDL